MNSEKLVHLILQDADDYQRLRQEFSNMLAEEQVMLAVALQAKGLLAYIRKESLEKSIDDIRNTLSSVEVRKILNDYIDFILALFKGMDREKLFVAIRVSNFNKSVSQMVLALCFANIMLDDDDLLTLIVRTLVSYYKIHNDVVPIIDTSVNLYKYRLKKAYGLEIIEDEDSSIK